MTTCISRVLVVLVLLTVAGCGDDDDTPASGDGSPTTRADASDETTTTAGTTTEVSESGWVRHEADEECECADGSAYQYFSRTADPEKVVLYFQGGGACFNEATCSFTDGTFKVATGAGDDPSRLPFGIFDLADERNPFADWSFIFVPYCTGDVHLGDATQEYGPGLVVEHNGYANASQGFDHLLAEFPDATNVFVTGSSAGGVPAPLFGGLVADALPDADVSVLADASGGYASNPLVNRTIGALWGVTANMPDWPETEGIDVSDFGIPDLFHLAGNHAPRVRMARFDNAFDETQETFVALAGLEQDSLLDVLEQNEALVEDNGVELATYVAPAGVHAILPRGAMYDLEIDGTSFIDWLTELIGGSLPADVRCTDCVTPSDSTTSTAPEPDE